MVLNFIHHGYYDGAFPSIARLGRPRHLVVYPYMLEDDAPLWLRQHVKVGSMNGGTAVSAAIGTDGMLELLAVGRSWPSPPTSPGVRRCGSSAATSSAPSVPPGWRPPPRRRSWS